jgi:hypothetical protein
MIGIMTGDIAGPMAGAIVANIHDSKKPHCAAFLLSAPLFEKVANGILPI